jgi:hypothetical protein
MMAEIFQLREFQAARERARNRKADQRSLEQAAAIMRDNLAAVAVRMKDASAEEQPELLDRVERLAAMIRYAMRMMGESDPATGSPR